MARPTSRPGGVSRTRRYQVLIYIFNVVLLSCSVAFSLLAVTRLRYRIYVLDLSPSHPTFLYGYVAVALQCGPLQILGIWGALRLHRNLVYLHLATLLLLLIGDLAAGLYWTARLTHLGRQLPAELGDNLQRLYGVDGRFTESWDLVQREERCCGVVNSLDYVDTLWYRHQPHGKVLPVSCCRFRGENERDPINYSCVSSLDNAFTHSNGCLQEFRRWLAGTSSLLFALGYCVVTLLKALFLSIMWKDVAAMFRLILASIRGFPHPEEHDLPPDDPRYLKASARAQATALHSSFPSSVSLTRIRAGSSRDWRDNDEDVEDYYSDDDVDDDGPEVFRSGDSREVLTPHHQTPSSARRGPVLLGVRKDKETPENLASSRAEATPISNKLDKVHEVDKGGKGIREKQSSPAELPVSTPSSVVVKQARITKLTDIQHYPQSPSSVLLVSPHTTHTVASLYYPQTSSSLSRPASRSSLKRPSSSSFSSTMNSSSQDTSCLRSERPTPLGLPPRPASAADCRSYRTPPTSCTSSTEDLRKAQAPVRHHRAWSSHRAPGRGVRLNPTWLQDDSRTEMWFKGQEAISPYLATSCHGSSIFTVANTLTKTTAF